MRVPVRVDRDGRVMALGVRNCFDDPAGAVIVSVQWTFRIEVIVATINETDVGEVIRVQGDGCTCTIHIEVDPLRSFEPKSPIGVVW